MWGLWICRIYNNINSIKKFSIIEMIMDAVALVGDRFFYNVGMNGWTIEKQRNKSLSHK